MTGQPAEAAFDALTKAGFWQDDQLVDDYRVIRMPVVRGGRLELTITELGTYDIRTDWGNPHALDASAFIAAGFGAGGLPHSSQFIRINQLAGAAA